MADQLQPGAGANSPGDAPAQGAAFAIERFLTGTNSRQEYLDDMKAMRTVPRRLGDSGPEADSPRVVPEHVDPDQRVCSFVEVVKTISAEQACREAARCLRCDLEH